MLHSFRAGHDANRGRNWHCLQDLTVPTEPRGALLTVSAGCASPGNDGIQQHFDVLWRGLQWSCLTVSSRDRFQAELRHSQSACLSGRCNHPRPLDGHRFPCLLHHRDWAFTRGRPGRDLERLLALPVIGRPPPVVAIGLRSLDVEGVRGQSWMAATRTEERDAAREPEGGTPRHPLDLQPEHSLHRFSLRSKNCQPTEYLL